MLRLKTMAKLVFGFSGFFLLFTPFGSCIRIFQKAKLLTIWPPRRQLPGPLEASLKMPESFFSRSGDDIHWVVTENWSGAEILMLLAFTNTFWFKVTSI